MFMERKARLQKNVAFRTLLDVMNFALDNTLIKNRDDYIYKQVNGIPMGDPHSPGMTIGACAWMERTWLQSLSHADKLTFTAKR